MQFQYGLDVQDREPENPSAPYSPAYQQLIEEAVVAGLNVPPPPPLATLEQLSLPGLVPAPPLPPPVPQPPVPPLNPPAAVMAAAAAAPTKLHNKPPEIFSGDQTQSETFMDHFNTYMMINERHEVMQTPYLCALFCLTLIKGPRVDD